MSEVLKVRSKREYLKLRINELMSEGLESKRIIQSLLIDNKDFISKAYVMKFCSQYGLTDKRFNAYKTKEKLQFPTIKERKPRVVYDKRYYGVRTRLFEILGKQCVKCGFSDIRALQFDHIHGGGTKEIKFFQQSRRSMYSYYTQHPDEAKERLQVLCANCNWIKRYENNECPKRN